MQLLSLLQSARAQGDAVLVVGLGVSGIEAARFLQRVGIRVRAIEKESEANYAKRRDFYTQVQALIAQGLEVYWEISNEASEVVQELVMRDVRLAVLSPGVPLSTPLMGAFHRKQILTVSELELGLELFRVPYVVVTGSNGKSTTVSLLQHVLQSAGMHSLLCGNVGTPVVSGLDATVLDSPPSAVELLVVEASSYQLEGCHWIKPRVGIFLNLSENHLERHGSMESYRDAKLQAFKRQDDAASTVLNADDEWVRPLHAKLSSRIWMFGQGHNWLPSASGYAQIVYEPGKGLDYIELHRHPTHTERFDLAGSSLLGLHNRYNMAAVICAAIDLGVQPTVLQRALISFQPLSHRIEPLPGKGPAVLNDSKSTTVAASVEALRTVTDHYRNRHVVLLLGGQAKAGSWASLAQLLQERRHALRSIIFFGKDGARVREALGKEGFRGGTDEIQVPTLQQATNLALERATQNDVVLLSPGCASFDEFANFEERGEFFKACVQSFRNTCA